MRKLFQIENIKTFSSNTFWVIISLHFLFYILIILAVSRIEISLGEFSISKLYQFPHVWEFFSWVASWFNILLGILVIVMICNEFRFYTFRQQVMNGLSERHLLTGKFYLILMITLYALLLVIASSLLSGNISTTNSVGLTQFSGLGTVMIFLLQTIAYLTMAMFFAVLFKNNGLAIVLFILYLFPGEVILRKLIFSGIQDYFPAKLISNLTPLPSMFQEQTESLKNMGLQMKQTQPEGSALETGQEIFMTFLYICIFLAVTYWILRKKKY